MQYGVGRTTIVMQHTSSTIFGLAVDAQGWLRNAQHGRQLAGELEVAVPRLVRLHEPDLAEIARVFQAQPLLWRCTPCTACR